MPISPTPPSGRKTNSAPLPSDFGVMSGFAASPPGEADVAGEDAMFGAVRRQKSKCPIRIKATIDSLGLFAAELHCQRPSSLACAVEPGAPNGGEAGAFTPPFQPVVGT